MNDATDTPRTDAIYPAEIIDREFADQGRNYGWGTLHDMREIARQLERELNEALKKVEQAKAYKRVMKEENATMRKEMQDAFQMLRVLSDNLMDDGPTWPRVLEWLTRNEKFKPETK